VPGVADREAVPRLRLAAATVAVAVGMSVSGCGGGGDDSTTTQKGSSAQGSGGISAAEKRAAQRRLAKELGVSQAKVKRLRAGHGLGATSIRPGEIIPGGPGPFFSSDTIYPVVNGWQASDHRSYTAVIAGANPADRSVGELGIFRQHFIKVTQSQRVLHVPGAGALKITRAPLGKDVAMWAQKHGNLRFVGKRGVRGTLHLRGDEVTIEHRAEPPK
jgi:hypothetical protein